MSTIESRDSLTSIEQKADGWTQVKGYLYLLWHRKWIILPIFIISMVIGLIRGLEEMPIYRAEALLQVQSAGGRGGFEETIGGVTPSFALETQIEIIKSRTVAERVARALRLQFEVTDDRSDWQKKWSRLAARLGKPEVDPPYALEALEIGQIDAGVGYRILFLDQSRFVVRKGRQTVVEEGRIGEPVQVGSVSFVVKGTGVPKAEAGVFVSTVRDAASRVQGSVSARTVRSTDILRIQADAQSAVLAKDIANRVSEEYMALILGRKVKGAVQSMEFIRDQLHPVMQNLDTAEDELSHFKLSRGLTSLSKDGQALMTQAVETDKEIQKLRLTRQEIQNALETLRNSSALGDNFAWSGIVGVLESSKVVSALSHELTGLLVRWASAKSQLTEHHPAVRHLEAQIARLKEQLIAELPKALVALQDKENLLKKKYQEYLTLLSGLPATEHELARLTMQVKVNQNTYDFLIKKQEELRLVSASQIANIWVIDEALPPYNSINPKGFKFLYMGGGLGLLAGILLVLFWERMDRTIKLPEEISSQIGLPCLGSIPLWDAKRMNGDLGKLVVLKESLSQAAEALRFLWTNLAFATIDRPRKILLVTSSGPGEGKSTVVANLGVTIAQLGKRVLVVDMDLRRPTQHKIFECSFSPGFTNYAVGESTFVQETVVPNLHVVTAGDHPPNPGVVLTSQSVQSFFARMAEQYDVILIDTPPLMPLADALMLGPYIDGLILLIKSRHTTLNVVRRCVASMRGLSPKVLGVVLNGIDEKRERYYDSSYHYYYASDDNGDRHRKRGKRSLAARLRDKLPPVLAGRK